MIQCDLYGDVVMKKTAVQQVFYYHFKTNWVWPVLTLLLAALLMNCLRHWPAFIYWWLMWALLGCCVYSLVLWGIKYLLPHKMAVIDDKYIKIDHCRPLPWRLVACAELKEARIFGRKLPIIAIRTKKPIRYRFNLLQLWCDKSDFTAFSIALYALTPKDVNRITALIAEKTILIS